MYICNGVHPYIVILFLIINFSKFLRGNFSLEGFQVLCKNLKVPPKAYSDKLYHHTFVHSTVYPRKLYHRLTVIQSYILTSVQCVAILFSNKYIKYIVQRTIICMYIICKSNMSINYICIIYYVLVP